jgi:hypothetical protein
MSQANPPTHRYGSMWRVHESTAQSISLDADALYPNGLEWKLIDKVLCSMADERSTWALSNKPVPVVRMMKRLGSSFI